MVAEPPFRAAASDFSYPSYPPASVFHRTNRREVCHGNSGDDRAGLGRVGLRHLEHVSETGTVRLVIPPQVAAVIARQRDQLTAACPEILP